MVVFGNDLSEDGCLVGMSPVEDGTEQDGGHEFGLDERDLGGAWVVNAEGLDLLDLAQVLVVALGFFQSRESFLVEHSDLDVTSGCLLVTLSPAQLLVRKSIVF